MLTRAIPVLRCAESRPAEAFYVRLGLRLVSGWRPDPARADPCYMAFVRDDAAVLVSSFPGDGVAGGGAMVWPTTSTRSIAASSPPACPSPCRRPTRIGASARSTCAIPTATVCASRRRARDDGRSRPGALEELTP